MSSRVSVPYRAGYHLLHNESMQARYTVSVKKVADGYSVWVPGLPGCASQGETESEALENIRDAIREYLSVAEDLSADGEKREVVLET